MTDWNKLGAREKAELVGVRVMDDPHHLRFYHLGLTDAWLVVERMRKLGWRLRLDDHGTEWRAVFQSKAGTMPKAATYRPTASEAICLAACRAVGVGV